MVWWDDEMGWCDGWWMLVCWCEWIWRELVVIIYLWSRISDIWPIFEWYWPIFGWFYTYLMIEHICRMMVGDGDDDWWVSVRCTIKNIVRPIWLMMVGDSIRLNEKHSLEASIIRRMWCYSTSSSPTINHHHQRAKYNIHDVRIEVRCVVVCEWWSMWWCHDVVCDDESWCVMMDRC
jgi:hypothetical protein